MSLSIRLRLTRLRKQRVGLNRGFHRVRGFYAGEDLVGTPIVHPGVESGWSLGTLMLGARCCGGTGERGLAVR
jgi:hypothetical protein